MLAAPSSESRVANSGLGGGPEDLGVELRKVGLAEEERGLIGMWCPRVLSPQQPPSWAEGTSQIWRFVVILGNLQVCPGVLLALLLASRFQRPCLLANMAAVQGGLRGIITCGALPMLQDPALPGCTPTSPGISHTESATIPLAQIAPGLFECLCLSLLAPGPRALFALTYA